MVVLSAVTPDAKQTNGDFETDWSARTWMAFTKQRLSVAVHDSAAQEVTAVAVSIQLRVQ